MSSPVVSHTGKGHITNLIYCPGLNGFAFADTQGYVTTYNNSCQEQQLQALIQKNEDDETNTAITSLCHFSKDRCSAAMGQFAYSLSLREGKKPTIKTEVFQFDTQCDLCVASPGQKWIAAIGDHNRVVLLDPSGENDQIDIKLHDVKEPHKCTFAQFDSSAQFLALHTTDNSIHIIDVKLGRVINSFAAILQDAKSLANSNVTDLSDSTFFSQSSFTHSFPASQSLFAVPCGSKISVYNVKNWQKSPGTIFSPTSSNPFIAVQFSHNNAVLAALNNDNELFIYNAVDNTYPLLFRYKVKNSLISPSSPSDSDPTSSQLTYLQFGPLNSSEKSNKKDKKDEKHEKMNKIADIVLGGRNGVIVSIPNLDILTDPMAYPGFDSIEAIKNNDEIDEDEKTMKIEQFQQWESNEKRLKHWPVSHLSSQFEIAKYNASMISSTPSKSPLKFKEDDSDGEDDEIITRSASKTQHNNKSVPKNEINDENNDSHGSLAKKRKEMNLSGIDKFDLNHGMDDGNKKLTSTPLKKQKIKDYNEDQSDDDLDEQNDDQMNDGDEDDDETRRAKLKNAILSTTVLKDTTIDLTQITELVREELHDHFSAQFKKNYITARNTELQPPFMPTSTKVHIPNAITGDQLRLLHASEYGSIVSRIHDDNATFGITLHTSKRVEKISLQFNEVHYSMATMDQYGIVLALPAYNGENKKGKASKKMSVPSQLLYQSFDDERNMNFSIELPYGESIECIALSKDVVAVATNKQFLRIYDLSGIELEVISLPGKVLTMTAKGPYLGVFYHMNSVPLADAHSIQMQMYQTETLHCVYDHIAALSPLSTLSWAYISTTGLLYTCDSHGIVRLFSSARGNSWKVICDLTTKVEEKEYHLWPVYIEFINESVDNSDKGWVQKIFSYECYKKKEPTPSLSMPTLKSTKLSIPFSRLLVGSLGEAQRKIQETVESSTRERLLWDELVSTHGQTITPQLNRHYDTPWVLLGIQLAQQGQSTRAIHICKQIRDIEMVKKFIEKINTMTHLHDLDHTIKELKKILVMKQSFKTLGLFPYQQPLPHAAMFKSKELYTMSQQPGHIQVNPFSSAQIQRTAAPTRDLQALVNDRVEKVEAMKKQQGNSGANSTNDPSPATSTAPAANPFRKSLQ